MYYLYGIVSIDENSSIGSVGLSTSGQPDEVRVRSHRGLGVVYSEKEIEDEG